jgi:hypothetical protein
VTDLIRAMESTWEAIRAAKPRSRRRWKLEERLRQLLHEQMRQEIQTRTQ